MGTSLTFVAEGHGVIEQPREIRARLGGAPAAVRGAAVKLVPVRVRGFDQPSDARAHRLRFAPASAFASRGEGHREDAAVGDGVPRKHVPELLLALRDGAAVVQVHAVKRRRARGSQRQHVAHVRGERRALRGRLRSEFADDVRVLVRHEDRGGGKSGRAAGFRAAG
eukprot:30161-Pelagococcus_subviridis.AAC.1